MFPTSRTAGSCYDGTHNNGTFCQTDNAALSWYAQASITSTAGIQSSLYNSFDTTDVNVRYEDPPVYSGGAETDVIYQQGALDPFVAGMAWCNDAVDSRKCDQHYVRFVDSSPSRQLACHETGHAVGLTHPTEADPASTASDSRYYCMMNDASNSYLGDHNVYEINRTY